MDDPSVQIVNQAQTWYTERAVEGTEYEGLPILSAAAPFKAGGRGGAEYYTDIPAGTLAVKNVADLYIYPNTLKVVKLTGAQVKEWLERSAGQFNRITPGNPNQPLLNEDFRSYNFDVIDGVNYEIDLSQPSKYDADGNLINENAERIVNLEYNGEPVTGDQEFLVATNNYRASGGGAFPGLDGSNIVIDSPDENRQIIIDYLTETETVNPSADDNWSFTDLPGDVTATFESAAAAQEALPEDAPVTFAGPSGEGFGTYQITF
jgi:2',3'-cyclic-nucleotide 2'-phosphodiesterase/3'-nucleotidase